MLRSNGVRGLLALLLAAVTLLPPTALPGGTATKAASGLTTTAGSGTPSSSVDHRIEAHRPPRSTVAWPGSTPADHLADTATLLCCGPTGTASAGRSTEPHLLAFQGRAPPSSGAPSVS